jgi:hypothetical protein
MPKTKSDRVKLNELVRCIIADIDVTSRGAGEFQVILHGTRANLVFVGNFSDCLSYLYGIRDMVTANG